MSGGFDLVVTSGKRASVRGNCETIPNVSGSSCGTGSASARKSRLTDTGGRRSNRDAAPARACGDCSMPASPRQPPARRRNHARRCMPCCRSDPWRPRPASWPANGHIGDRRAPASIAPYTSRRVDSSYGTVTGCIPSRTSASLRRIRPCTGPSPLPSKRASRRWRPASDAPHNHTHHTIPEDEHGRAVRIQRRSHGESRTLSDRHS